MASGNPITLEDVASAIAELRASNQKVTILAIRDKLGRGSFTTVKKHLERLAEDDAPPTASPVPAQLESLWAEAKRAAEAELESGRAALRDLADELEARFEAMQAAIAEANSARSLAETRLADRTAELERSLAVIEDLRRAEALRVAADTALAQERDRGDRMWEHASAMLADLQNSVTQLQAHGVAIADLVTASARSVTADLAEFATLEKESRIQDQQLLRHEVNDWIAPFSQVPASVANVERTLIRVSRGLAGKDVASRRLNRRRS